MNDRKICPRCGSVHPLSVLGCSRCGQPFPVNVSGDYILPSQKSPSRAFFLSFALLAGFGQIYVGQPAKGLVWMVIALLAGIPTFGLGTILANLASGIDAQKVARKLSRGEAAGTWEWFPN